MARICPLCPSDCSRSLRLDCRIALLAVTCLVQNGVSPVSLPRHGSRSLGNHHYDGFQDGLLVARDSVAHRSALMARHRNDISSASAATTATDGNSGLNPSCKSACSSYLMVQKNCDTIDPTGEAALACVCTADVFNSTIQCAECDSSYIMAGIEGMTFGQILHKGLDECQAIGHPVSGVNVSSLPSSLANATGSASSSGSSATPSPTLSVGGTDGSSGSSTYINTSKVNTNLPSSTNVTSSTSTLSSTSHNSTTKTGAATKRFADAGIPAISLFGAVIMILLT